MIRAVVQAEPIDLAAEIVAVEHTGVGAVATFSGYVRSDDGVTSLELEHYPGMTEDALHRLAEAAGAAVELERGQRNPPRGCYGAGRLHRVRGNRGASSRGGARCLRGAYRPAENVGTVLET